MAEGGGRENQTDRQLQATPFYQWRGERRSQVTPEEEDLPSPTLLGTFGFQEGPLPSINGGKKEEVKRIHELQEDNQSLREYLSIWQDTLAINQTELHESSAVKDKRIHELQEDNQSLREYLSIWQDTLAINQTELHESSAVKDKQMKKVLHELQEEKVLNQSLRENQSVLQESVASMEKQLRKLSAVKNEVQGLEMLRKNCYSLYIRHTALLQERLKWEKTIHKVFHELQEEKVMNQSLRENQSSMAIMEKQLHEVSADKDKVFHELQEEKVMNQSLRENQSSMASMEKQLHEVSAGKDKLHQLMKKVFNERQIENEKNKRLQENLEKQLHVKDKEIQELMEQVQDVTRFIWVSHRSCQRQQTLPRK